MDRRKWFLCRHCLPASVQDDTGFCIKRDLHNPANRKFRKACYDSGKYVSGEIPPFHDHFQGRIFAYHFPRSLSCGDDADAASIF
jgi:hypothetical protein